MLRELVEYWKLLYKTRLPLEKVQYNIMQE